MAGYTCYVLTEDSKKALLSAFPAQYARVFGEHVTDKFFVGAETPIVAAKSVAVVGYADSGDGGLEAVVVEVNGNSVRADGSLYHITLSLNPEVEVAGDVAARAAALGYVPKTPGYTPAHSNHLLLERGYTPLPPRWLEIEVTPRFFNFETQAFEAANVV